MDKIPRWIKRILFMLIAIGASYLLLDIPTLSFHSDTGIIYVRDYSMTTELFTVTQTELKTGVAIVAETMSVKGFKFCAYAMLTFACLAFLCFFNTMWRSILCLFSALSAGLYYGLMIYYSIQIAENHMATVYPNWGAILPFIVILMMELVRKDTTRSLMSRVASDDEAEDEEADEEYEEGPTDE